MAKFDVNSTVYVPSRFLADAVERPHALTLATVMQQRKRSVRINHQDADGNDIWVSSKVLHGPDLGLTIFRIGGFVTEGTTLDPLAKSTLQFLRLLLPDDALRLVEVRTAVELAKAWTELEPITSHVVIICHGSGDSVSLMDRPEPVSGADLAQLFPLKDSGPKQFIFLSCLTGRAAFARPFSASAVCSDLFAPFQSVHAAAASLFAQSYFTNHLLNGRGVLAASSRALSAVGNGVVFRHYRDGKRRKAFEE